MQSESSLQGGLALKLAQPFKAQFTRAQNDSAYIADLLAEMGYPLLKGFISKTYYTLSWGPAFIMTYYSVNEGIIIQRDVKLLNASTKYQVSKIDEIELYWHLYPGRIDTSKTPVFAEPERTIHIPNTTLAHIPIAVLHGPINSAFEKWYGYKLSGLGIDIRRGCVSWSNIGLGQGTTDFVEGNLLEKTVQKVLAINKHICTNRSQSDLYIHNVLAVTILRHFFEESGTCIEDLGLGIIAEKPDSLVRQLPGFPHDAHFEDHDPSDDIPF